MRIRAILTAALVLCFHGIADAQKLVPGKAGRSVTSIQLPLLEAGTRTITFWYVVRGNESTPFTATLSGPVLAKAHIEGKIVRGSIPAALSSQAGWYQLEMEEDDLAFTPSPYQPLRLAATKSCDSIPAEVVQAVIDLYAKMGRTPTQAEICTFYLNSPDGSIPVAPTPDPNAPNYDYLKGYVSTRGILQKDTCGTRASAKYLVRIVVNVDDVEPGIRLSGYKITATFKTVPYRGKKAASIKPVSDGKFAPQPLILMNSVGGLGRNPEQVKVYSWKAGMPILTQQLRVEDYIPYKGLYLGRTVVTSALTGSGRATFEATNGFLAYSVCFKRLRVRQKANGYQ